MTFGGVGLLSFADGGFFPTAWRAAAVAFFCAAALAFVLGRVSLGRSQILMLGALAALTAWTALSALWSPEPGDSLLEAQRTLVYLAFVLAAAAIAGSLVTGVLAGTGVVCGYALGQRLLEGSPDPPDPFEGTLLQEPLGYANGLGGLAAIGFAIAISRLVSKPHLLHRAFHGVLAFGFLATLYLTGSRGGWLAALVGASVVVALGSGRLQLARAIATIAALGLAVALALPAGGSLADELAARGGDRAWYWSVAWNEVADAPVIGRGAGTFDLAWLERQPIPVGTLDAHSLYLEMLAELGLTGLALLLVALAGPLATAFRGAHAAATGGYVAFLIHAGVDWDWELPAVTVAGLACGAAIITCTSAQVTSPDSVYLTNPPKGVS